MFRHYSVILRELIVSTLPSYTSMSVQLLVIQYKISHMFYAVEISMFKILKLSYYTGCPRRNVKYFGRVFLMLNYTDITQNTYIQS